MVSIKTLLLLFAAATLLVEAGTASYSHGAAGVFQKAGRVNWRGFGYYSRTSSRWVPLKNPDVGGATVAASQIAGTSDGGAIIVGSFTSINGRSAAGIALYRADLDDWFPVAGAGLYRVLGGSPTSLPCRNNNGTGIQYITRNAAGAAVTPFSSSSAIIIGPNFAVLPEPIVYPPVVDPSNGETRILNAGNPFTQAQTQYHFVGNGRAIIPDSANPNEFYVFGNFDHVGLDVDAPHNRNVQAAGLVKFTYSPGTRSLTPSIIGTRGYTARRATDPQDSLHPRECGRYGNELCGTTDCQQTNLNSPHTANDAVQAGLTRDASGIHIFVQETNADVMRWSPEAAFWVNVNVNGGGQELVGASSTSLLAQNINFRATNFVNNLQNRSSNPNAAGFSWSISKDQSTVFMWKNVFPNTAQFNNGNGLQGWGSFTWDDGTQGTRAMFGGLKSTSARGDTWESIWNDSNFPSAIFRNVPVSLPNQPALLSLGPVARFAVSRTVQLTLSDERLPGLPTFAQNRYANAQFLKVKRVTGGSAAATIDASTGIQWVCGLRPVNPANDANGNPRFAYDTNYVQLNRIREVGNEVWVWSANPGSEIFYEPTLDLPPGHTGNTYARRFKRTLGSPVMAYDGNRWFNPLGGLEGNTFAPISFWDSSISTTVGQTTTTDNRVYFYDGVATAKWNFNLQSGVALYDPATYRWVDPFDTLRVVSLTQNWYDGDRLAEVGVRGLVTLTHKIEAGPWIFAGQFSFLGDSHFGSIVQWSESSVPGAGFSAVGSAQTGLYRQNIALQSQPKRWIEAFAPSDQNRKVDEGAVQCITNLARRVFVGGSFDRSSNSLSDNNYLQNVAVISDISDNTATWQSVDGGCNAAPTQLLVYKGFLYASGPFTNCGSWTSGPKSSVARINVALTATDRWQTLASGVSGGVSALVLYGDNLVLGGAFTSADNSGYGRVALWNGEAFSYLGTGCNDVCSQKRLTAYAATVAQNGLGTMLNVDVFTLQAGAPGLVDAGRLWAIVNGPVLTASGAAAAGNELVYYENGQWYRSSNGGYVMSSGDTFNGFLVRNGTEILVGNLDLANSPLTNGWFQTGAGVGNLAGIIQRPTDQPQGITVYPGFQGFDGQIVHLSPASSVSISLCLLLALILAVIA